MLFLYFAGIVLLTAIDQLSKWWVVEHLPFQQEVPVIENIFNLTYDTNPGAGMGILKGQFWLFFLVTALVAICVTVYMLKARPKRVGLVMSLTLLVGGALGNCIDRIVRGEVVDFLDFGGLYFPFIFNLADCFIVVGAVLLAIYIILWDTEPKKKSTESESNSETE